MINFHTCSMSWNLCGTRELRLYLNSYEQIRTRIDETQEIPAQSGRPRSIDDEAVMSAWIQYEKRSLDQGRRPTVAKFCMENGIKRRTFYCARTRWKAAGYGVEVCKKFIDWGEA